MSHLAPASPPRPHRRASLSRIARRRGRLAALGLLAALAVVGATLTGPVSAEAATRSSVSTVAGALQAGTIVDDITSGRIDVDQLVDTAEAAWASGGSGAASRPSRAELTRQVTSEVRALRTPGGFAAPEGRIDVSATAAGQLTASADTLRTSASWKHFWKKVKHAVTPHWQTVYLSPTALKIIVSSAGAVGAAFFCATPGVGSLACGFFYALVGVLSGVWSADVPCGNRGWDAYIPDVWNSHCA